MSDDNLIAVTYAMWEAVRRPDNPQLPVAITYWQLRESDRAQLLKMAEAAISVMKRAWQ